MDWGLRLQERTYEVPLTNGNKVKTIGGAISLLDMGAWVNLVHPSLISTCSNHRIKRHDFLRLRIATRKPIQLNGWILLYLCLGDKCTLLWFGIARFLAVDIFLGTAFMDRIIRENVPIWMKRCSLKFPAHCNCSTKASNTGVKIVQWSTRKTWKAEQVVDDAKEKS